MTYSLLKGSFNEINERLETALSWLISLNVDIGQPRIDRYRRDLSEIVQAIQSGTTERLVAGGGFLQRLNSFHEAYILVSIHKGLRDCTPSPALLSRLQLSLSGPPSIVDESPNDGSHEGRDFEFELILASLFTQANYKWDPQSTTDVLVSDPPIHLRIECKRPTGPAAVRNAVRRAFGQLKKTLKPANNPDTTYGLVALSVEKLIVPPNQFLHPERTGDVSVLLDRDLFKFANNFRTHWRNPGHHRIIGILLFVKTPAVIKSENIPTSVSYMHFVPLVTERSLGFSVIESMSKKINTVINS